MAQDLLPANGGAMFRAIQMVAMASVVIALAPALAHAFEFPGKKRLNRDIYVAVQAIYYPGFTLLGVAEPAGAIVLIVLLLLTPRGSAAFWLTVIALAGLLGMQLIYWAVTHPTNRYWLQSAGVAAGPAGGHFFGFEPLGRPAAKAGRADVDWRKLRDRWEYSHIARAGLALLSFFALLIAIGCR